MEIPSTPKSEKSTVNPGSLSTPYSQSSHRSHDSTPRSQHVLQDAMKDELRYGTFDSKSWLDRRCPAGRGVVDRVIADLKSLKVSHESLQYLDVDVSSKLKPWPLPTAPEREHYKPFTWFLNEILRLSRVHVETPSFHANLHFFTYDRPVLEGVDQDWPLKPDIVGCNRQTLPDTDKVSWKDVHIPVEVKGRWPDMVSQASTYARCCLTFQENRDTLPAIHFNQMRREVRLGFYMREGLDSSEVFEISTMDGFRNFVHAVVGIYSWKDASSAGIDATRQGDQFLIPNGKIYSIRQSFCNRKCVLGRATRVYLLEEDKAQTQPGLEAVPPPPLPQAAPRNRYHLRSLQHRLPSPIEATIPAVQHMSLQEGGPSKSKSDASPPSKPASNKVGRNSKAKKSHAALDTMFHEWDVDITLPETGCAPFPPCNVALWHMMTEVDPMEITVPTFVILKDSWPLESHCNEGAIFQCLHGKFGLPVVLFAYRVKTGAGHIPHDAMYWDVFGTGNDPGIQPERRIHMRIVLATQGTSLLDSPSPRRLVEGVVHAMLGHYNMFKEGWLHRDVSIGNVMLMRAEERLPVEHFDVTKKLTECVGFISDGDQAIRWKDDQRNFATRRSGTLPFMSLRLITAWDTGEQVPHTAIDDLESFIWVLFWSVLWILNEKRALSDVERRMFLRSMCSDTLSELRNRAQFLRVLRYKEAANELSTGLKPFSTLLIRWLEISEKAASHSSKPSAGPDSLEEYCGAFYQEYVEAGLELMQQLPEGWDYFK